MIPLLKIDKRSPTLTINKVVSLQGGRMNFGNCVCFERHLGLLHAQYQILIKAHINIFEYQSMSEHRNMAILQDSKSVLHFSHNQKVQIHVFSKFNCNSHDKYWYI